MAKIISTIIFITLACGSTLVAAANTPEELERENLTRIIREVDYLIDEVKKIEKSAQNNNRVQFQYQLLIDDLIKIRQGVADHVNGSLDAARPIKSLNGVYGR